MCRKDIQSLEEARNYIDMYGKEVFESKGVFQYVDKIKSVTDRGQGKIDFMSFQCYETSSKYQFCWFIPKDGQNPQNSYQIYNFNLKYLTIWLPKQSNFDQGQVDEDEL